MPAFGRDEKLTRKQMERIVDWLRGEKSRAQFKISPIGLAGRRVFLTPLEGANGDKIG